MALSSVKAIFEIGHEAELKRKEGLTHDWTLFIRGVEKLDNIGEYIEKVVFILHDTFEVPIRVVNKPPFMIDEQGYAGFTVLLDVYLKTRAPSEPHKLHFEYDLTLPVDKGRFKNVVKKTYIFDNPSEDFRRKLIKGGGVGVNDRLTSHSSLTANPNSSNTSGSKSRLSPQDNMRKSKKENSSKQDDRLNPNNSFSIFGEPILKKEIPYATASKSNSKSAPEKSSQSAEKQSTHASKSSKYNSSSHKEKERDKEKEREKEKSVEKQKDREKEKNAASLKRSSKDGESGVPTKKVKKEEKDKVSKSSSKDESKMKSMYHEDKQKEKEKSVEKPAEKEAKSDKKEKEKKHKDVDKKVKSKEKYKTDKKDSEHYVDRTEKSAPATKEDVVAVKEEKKAHEKEDRQTTKDKSLYETTASVTPAAASTLKDDKHKHHKHKKEKSKKEGKRDKEEKKEKSKEVKSESKERTPVQTELPPKAAPKPADRKPLKTLFDELSDKSDSDSSSDDEMSAPQTLHESASANSSPDLTVVRTDAAAYAKDEKLDGRRRSKKVQSEEKEAKKRNKRKSKHRDDSPTPVKMNRFMDHRGAEENRAHNGLGDGLQTSVSPIPDPKFTDAYISKLKVLQEKIMTLDDNSGLQRIVQVVAETGQYEITTKTFDFDLCSLDEKIVDRLLDFF